MTYLVVTPGFSGKDGVSRLTREFVSALGEVSPDAAIEVWSLAEDTREVDGFFENPRVRVRGAAGSKARIVSWSFDRALRGCRELDIIVMHAHLAPLSLPFRARGARIFQVLCGIEVWKQLSFLQGRAFGWAERLICISRHSEQAFAEFNPGYERTVVCHPGIAKCADDGAPQDDFFALMVGRMSSQERYKGHDAVLDEWRGVLDAVPGAKLVIAGDGDDAPRLRAKAASLGLDEVVRFVGPVPDDELYRLYQRCSFFVLPSRNEGFGLVFLEAMRAKKACVGGRGAASEIIEDGTTGFVVDASEPDSIRGRVVDLFRRPELRRRMGENGAARFERLFSETSFRERLGEVLALR